MKLRVARRVVGDLDARFSLYQNRIAKLMGPVAPCIKLLLGSAQCCIVRECFEQLAMTGAGLMNSRENRIYNAEPGSWADALRRYSIASVHTAVLAGSVFQCADYRRADCDNAAAMRPRALDGGGGRF